MIHVSQNYISGVHRFYTIGSGTSNDDLSIVSTYPKYETLRIQSSNIHISGSILPSACNVYDLGSSNYRFRDLYLSGNTIDLGGTRISRDDTTGGMKITSLTTNEPVDIKAKHIYASSNVFASNVIVYGNIKFNNVSLKNNIQVNPLRKVFFVETPGQTVFGLSTPGYYGGEASNVQVFVDHTLLTYYSSNYTDYQLSYLYNSTNLTTDYTITLTQGVPYGTYVDITLFPTLLAESTPQGFVYQNVVLDASSFTTFATQGSSIYYNNGNVGIGTNLPISKLDVRGNIVCSNISVLGDFVTLNTITSNTEQMVIENAGTGPALKVTQTGENSVAEFYDKESGVALFVGNNGNVGVGTNVSMSKLHVAGSLSNMVVDSRGYVGVGTINPAQPFHVEGNAYINGSLNTNNMEMFRNRVINGDMRILTDGIQGVSGTNAMTTGSVPNWSISTGAYSPSITTQQIALSSNDQVTTGQTYALEIRPTNQPLGLMAYFPFEDALKDASGNNVFLTGIGNIMYVPGKVGNQCVYLANEANVVNTQTRAANSLIMPYTSVSGTTTSLSYWFYCTKLPTAAGNQCTISSFGSASAGTITMYFQYLTASTANLYSYNLSTNSTPYVISVNTWYHVVQTITTGGSTVFYVNGSLIGSVGSTPTTNVTGSIFIQFSDQVYTTTTQPFAGYIDDVRIYNRILTQTEITAFYNQTPFQPILPPSSGLTHLYPFDGSLTNNGSVGGSLTSSPTAISYAPGGLVGSQCLYLANEANVTASSAATYYVTRSYTFPSSFTVSMWVMSTKLNASVNSVPFSTNSGSAALTNSIYINFGGNGLISIGFYTGSSTGYPAYSINTWYFLTIIYSSGTLQLYINNQYYGSCSGTMAQNGFMLGNTGTTATNAFAGYIDDFRIYNSVLTPSQIAAIYYNTNTTYTNVQQLIDGSSLADFNWGTNGAMPITLTTWLKNNTLSSQSYSISMNSTGLIAHLTFENDYNDTLGGGFLSAPRILASTGFTSTAGQFKVGSTALNLNANTAASASPVAGVDYNVNFNLNTDGPFTISFWMRPSVVNVNYQDVLGFGNNTNEVIGFVMLSSGLINVQGNGASEGNALNFSTTNNTPLIADNWYHIGCTLSYNEPVKFYINGVLVGITRIITSFLSPILRMRIGTNSYNLGYTNAYKGFVDDVRIYNRALTPAQIKALYDANVSSTTLITDPKITLPIRNFIYNTPIIPSNTWQKVQVTIPADSLGSWDTRPGQTGGILSFCLGGGPSYSNILTNTWTNNLEYMGNTTQMINYDSNGFLTASSNALWMTGVQLEKGNLATSFDLRPYTIEKQLVKTTIPILYADMSGGGWVSYTTNTILKFNYVQIDTTSSYNKTTGYFTAPIAGYYRCFISYLAGYLGGSVQCYLYRNGTQQRGSIHNNTNTYSLWINTSGEKIVYCNVGDSLYWVVNTGTPTSLYLEDYTHMSIYYLG